MGLDPRENQSGKHSPPHSSWTRWWAAAFLTCYSQRNDHNYRYALVFDTTVTCYEGTHAALLGLSVLFVLFLGVGAPAYMARFLRGLSRRRRRRQQRRGRGRKTAPEQHLVAGAVDTVISREETDEKNDEDHEEEEEEEEENGLDQPTASHVSSS